jgi:hypothetical protein
MKKKNIIRSEFFAKFEAKQDIASDGIKGVLVITEGPAKGHFCVEVNGKLRPYNPDDSSHEKLEKIPVFITAQTLRQVAESGNSRSEVKAKLDHGETVRDTFGGYSNFRVDGTSVYADLKFLEGTPHRSFVEGIASRFADEFGNSIDFQSSYSLGQDSTGKKIAIANCLRLGSIDLVDSPAATNSLFEEQDSPLPSDSMPLSPEDLATIGDMITKAVADATSADKQQDAATIEERLAKLEAAGAPEKKEEPTKMEGAPEKKDEEAPADEKLSAMIEKASLKVAQEQFMKLSTGFVKTKDGDGSKIADEFEAAVQAQLSSGCKSRGLALHRIAQDNPKLYNEAAKNGKI